MLYSCSACKENPASRIHPEILEKKISDKFWDWLRANRKEINTDYTGSVNKSGDMVLKGHPDLELGFSDLQSELRRFDIELYFYTDFAGDYEIAADEAFSRIAERLPVLIPDDCKWLAAHLCPLRMDGDRAKGIFLFAVE